MNIALGDIILKYLLFIFLPITAIIITIAVIWYFIQFLFPSSEYKIERIYNALMKPLSVIWKYLGIVVLFFVVIKVFAELLGWSNRG